MVEAVLAVEPVYHASLDRLHYNHAGVEVSLLIHVVDDPVDEAAEEVSFAKLDDSLRRMAFGGCARVKCFE